MIKVGKQKGPRRGPNKCATPTKAQYRGVPEHPTPCACVCGTCSCCCPMCCTCGCAPEECYEYDDSMFTRSNA